MKTDGLIDPRFLLLFITILFCNGDKLVLKNPWIRFVSNPTQFHFGYWGGENVTLEYSNETLYVIPKNLTQVTIVFNASYPITWIFHNEHVSKEKNRIIFNAETIVQRFSCLILNS